MFQTGHKPNKAPNKNSQAESKKKGVKNSYPKMLPVLSQDLNNGPEVTQMKEEEEELPQQTKSAPLQPRIKEDEEPLQGKVLTSQMKEGPSDTRSQDTNPVFSKMNAAIQEKMETSFGTDFHDVNIHQNDSSATQMGALAYTQGNDVHFAPGQYDPNTKSGQELLGHELTHVVQQRQRLVSSNRQRKNIAVNDSPALEKEANENGKKAASGNKLENKNANTPNNKEANSTTIQRLYQPITVQAPSDAIGIEEFIQLVREEEQKYSEEEQRNTSLMITRLRKIFYGAKSWDKNLIRGVEDIESPYGTPKEKERSRKTVEIGLGPLTDFDIVDTETYPVDPETGKRPEIYQNQEISLPDGTFIDMGHIFAGLDAFNHRHNVAAPIFSDIAIDNVEGTTWVGDLGSVLAEVQVFALSKGGDINEHEIQALINEYASPQDMLGNIDAYAIEDSYDIDGTALKVSDILQDFYLGQGVETNQSRRYSIFAAGIGLKNWNGSGWSNEDERVEHYMDQVNDAAAMYIGANASTINILSLGGFVLGMSKNEGSRGLVQLFFNALRIKVFNETMTK